MSMFVRLIPPLLRVVCGHFALASIVGLVPQLCFGESVVNNTANIQPALSHFESSSFLHNLEGLLLLDQSNKPFRPESLKGQVVLFNFIFTRCGSVCPTQTRDLATVQKRLGADVLDQVHFVSVSVDPDHDTPQVLNSFAQKMRANSDHWSFLTGSETQLQKLFDRLKVKKADGQQSQIEIHRTSLWIVDKQGRMLQRYKGDPIDKTRLIRELTQIASLGL